MLSPIQTIRRRVARLLDIEQCQICWEITHTKMTWVPTIIEGVTLDVNIRSCVNCVPMFDWQGIRFQ